MSGRALVDGSKIPQKKGRFDVKKKGVDSSSQEVGVEIIDRQKLWTTLYKGYGPDQDVNAQKNSKELIKEFLRQSIAGEQSLSEYNLLFLHDSSTMVKSDADYIYNAVTTFAADKPLLLVLYSMGGIIGSAYLIGKLCREYSKGKFAVVVPRQAKSAATLLCCAADEIHMGSLSELGPIDPQIDGFPALGLKNSIEHIAQLVKETPESADMFAKYLRFTLKPINLGYYERTAESAKQYAIRLLNTHGGSLPSEPEQIAHALVYSYKDHGFVIDKGEAKIIFGEKIVKSGTPEYALGNKAYIALSEIEGLLGLLRHNLYFIGSQDSEPTIRRFRE